MTTENGTVHPRRLALLIDGDNVSAALLEKILAKTAEHGLITIKRIYGDWTRPAMNGWRPMLHDHAARPIQQFQYTVGKNATDCALIIDAMDILYSGRVDGFCLAASDSDYTRLAIRIQEQGLFIMGIGAAQTPHAFVNACNQFFYTTELLPTQSPTNHEQPNVAATVTTNGATNGATNGHRNGHQPANDDPRPLIKQAFEVIDGGEDGWVNLSRLASQIRQLDPRFDVRNFGHKQFSHLLKSYPDTFKMQYRGRRNITVKLLERTSEPSKPPKAAPAKPTTEEQPSVSVSSLKQAFGKAVQEKGWINLEVLRSCLHEIDPIFAKTNPSREMLTEFVQANPDTFEVKTGVNGRKQSSVYVRLKQLVIA